jgi:DNA topoisomerase-3
MLGILTEKPSAGRNFAKALGGQRGNFNGEDYIIVSARGHLYEFIDVSKMVAGEDLQAKYKSWDVNNLPWNHTELNWKRTPQKDTESTLREIKNTLSSCSEIAIATDVARQVKAIYSVWKFLKSLGLPKTTYEIFLYRRVRKRDSESVQDPQTDTEYA